jgi:hypothetical protein
MDEPVDKPGLVADDRILPVEPVIENRPNYFVRHWRGELSLGISYWINSLIGNATLFLEIMILRTKQEKSHSCNANVKCWRKQDLIFSPMFKQRMES